MSKLTLDQFVAQWTKNASSRQIVSRFEYNVFEFTTLAGNYSKRFFATSFIAGGFYKSGRKWEARKSKWGKKFTHPVMTDTGTLRKAIKGESRQVRLTGWTDARKRLFKRGGVCNIYTDERSLPIRGKRGKSKGYKRYAAIHNTDPRYSNFTVNQYSSRKPVQRQFIGFSKVLDRDIEKFIPILFKGFPGNA